MANGDHLSGAMIALMPTKEDALRLALKGGELPGDLHCTLYYLGPDATVFDQDARQMIIDCVQMCAMDTPVLQAKIFGISHWNAGGDSPSWVWSVGDMPGADDTECGLEDIHEDIDSGLDMMFGDLDDVPFPDQHSPWVAHICAIYTDDLTFAADLEKRNGPVTFDRIRVSFGDEDHDIPLMTDGMAAAGQLRRKLSEFEVASRADFAMIDRQWEDAVGAALHDYARAEEEQRSQLKAQITAAIDSDSPDDLGKLHVDTDHMAVLLADHMKRLAITAGKEMQREAEHQGVTIPPWDLDVSLTASSAIEVISSVARVSARALGLNLVQSAAKRALTFITSGRSGKSVASEVDSGLKDLSTRSPREYISAAMSSAQNAGRMAVLTVAPVGRYMATEVLDKNTCGPCRTIDGTEFTSLSQAAEAYPAGGGGYANCAGGGRCRGTMIAVWDAASVGSAAQEVFMATATEQLGGKPNPGTKKDKRLKENDQKYATDCPEGEDCSGDMAAHLADTETVSMAWDGSASRFTPEQYQKAAAACDAGEGSPKERCFLPHHEPGGALNEDGLSAAAGRVNQLSGHDPAAVARAKSHLRGHYSTLGKPVPSNLKATSDEVAAFALEDDYDLIIWGAPAQLADAPQDCPPGMMMDPATGECGPMPDGSKSEADTANWEGVLAVEDQVTGDGREFAAGALTWPDEIQPGEVLLRWNKEDSHGGTPTTKAVTVGRIDSIWRDGTKIMGKGVFDLGSEDGAEAHRRVEQKFLRGVSIDADSIGQADVEFVWPEDSTDGEGEDALMMLFAQPEKVIFHGGRIRAATLCDIPAFAEAWIALTDDSGAVVAGGAPSLEQYAENQQAIVSQRMKFRPHGKSLKDALVAHAAPQWRPPAEWFSNPNLTQPTTIHVTDDGRVFGHAAQWGACHIGFMDVCTQPPREDDFPYFLTGELTADDGSTVTVGQITVTANHADLYAAAGPAKEHYENTGNAIADVHVGADRVGIWVAGAIRPGADPALVHELRASGEVSGDWRRIGGQHRLVGLLGVNVGGFVVPRMKARVASGQVQALVAAGRLTTAHGSDHRSGEMDLQTARRIVMDDLARQMTEGSE